MKKHAGTMLAMLLAAAVIFAGFSITRLAEKWLSPAQQPVYVPTDALPTTVLRLEESDYLLLYPMDAYSSDTAVPAMDTPRYKEAYDTFQRLLKEERRNDDPLTEERIALLYHTTLNNILTEKIADFFSLDTDNTERYDAQPEFDHDAYMIEHLEYQPENDLFYLRDFHVTMDLYALHTSQPMAVIPGNITAAFYGDLLGELELVYLRFDTSSPHTELTPAECYSWLMAHHRIYGGYPSPNTYYPVEERPLDGLMTYLRRRYNALRGSGAASWEQLEENFDCILYRNELLCILSAANQRVIFTYDPEVDSFVEFSVQTF